MQRKLILGAIALMGLTGTALAETRITFWSPDANGLTPRAVEAFNASQDEIFVELSTRDFSSMVADSVRAFATGNAPDLLEIDNPEVAVFSSRGVLADLTGIAATAKHFDVEKMLPGPRAAGTWDGKLYGIPKAANTIALYYNADLFKASGLDPDNPPKTWSELADAAAKLNDPENGVSGLSFSAAPNEEGTFQFLPWIQMAGANYDSMDSEGAIAALQFWTDLYESGNVTADAITTGQWDLTGAFNAGGAAMHISGPWELERMSKTAEFDWRVTLLPTKDGSDLRSSALGEFMHVVNKDSENIEAAFKFIDFFHSYDENLWNAFGLMPGFDGIDTEAENYAEAFAVFSEQIKYAQVRGPHPDWPKISKAIQTAIQSSLTGQVSAEEAAKSAAAEIAEILN